MSVIIIIEPHPLLRLGIQQLLASELPDNNIVGADYASLGQPNSEQDCALVILSLQSLDERHVLLNATSQTYSPSAILLLADPPSASDWFYDCPPAVVGYVPKNATPELLLASIKLALAGGTCFPPRRTAPSSESSTRLPLPPHLVHVAPSQPAADATCDEHIKLGLTPRQYEVLVLLARGHSMKTISSKLSISVATAKAHTEMLYQRLDVHSRNAAVFRAIELGATLGWPTIQAAKQHAAE